MEGYFDGRRGQIYVAHLADDPDVPGAGGADGAGGDRIERITDADYDHANPEWGDASTLYYTVSDGEPDPDDADEHTLLAYDTGTGDRAELHTITAWGTALAATADGRVAYRHVDPDRMSLRPVELRVLDADGAVHDPLADLDRSLARDAVPEWGPDEERLYVRVPDEGADALVRSEWDGGTVERVHREDWARLSGVHVGEDVVALVQSEWDHPGDVFLTTPAGAESRRLTRVNAGYLDGRAVAEPEEIRIDSGDREIQGWVLRPPDFDPDRQYPLVVEVHGGPHSMWTASGTVWHEFQTLAARGYVVFWSNPRGSLGYGADFAAAIDRDWGAVTAADLLAGVDRVAERDYVDGDQAFLTGGSFGGFMTAWLVGHTDRFAAAVAQRGVYDLTGFYGSTDGAYKLVEGDFDTTPWDEPAFLWEQSPASAARDVTTPTLLLHADDDTRTPASTAELFYRGLRTAGVDTRLVRYPGEGHELSRSGQPGHVVDRIERIARWFDGYSEYHDAARALARPAGDGLTADAGEGTGAGGD
jgi:dipeptidyl aminopeptidase/acylaminoacyl peptidase